MSLSITTVQMPVDTARFAPILWRKERRNSERSGYRTRQTCGFFVPGHFYGREAPEAQHPSGGNTGGRLRSVSNLPATSPGCVETAQREFNELAQESVMSHAPVLPFVFRDRPIRVVVREGEPWFVAADVAAALEYRDAEVAARHLGSHQKADTPIRCIGSSGHEQTRNFTIINESGLYRLVLRSRKPEAVAFSDWVTGEVLPSIRKTGGYGHAEHYARCARMAQAIASVAHQAVFDQLVQSGDSADTRFLVRISHDGGADVRAIDPCALVASIAGIADMIAAPGGTAPSDAELAALAKACIERLAARMQKREQQGGLRPTPTPRADDDSHDAEYAAERAELRHQLIESARDMVADYGR